jgi:hypothetical protein
MTRIAVCVAGLAVLSLASANSVRAEPITIIAGSLSVTSVAEVAPFTLQGTRGFSLNGSADTGEGRVDPFICLPCAPGVQSVGANLSGPAIFGTATLDGATYTLTSAIDSPASMALEFNGAVTMPATGGRPIVIRAPFTLDGIFSPTFPAGPVQLTGGGVASLFLSPDIGDPAAWNVDRVRYDFGAQQAPIPEPASLTLLGLAFAAAALRARKGSPV